MAALSRGEPWPAARKLAGQSDPFAALVSLFLLGHRVSWAPWLETFEQLGLLRRDVDEAVPVLELRPYDDDALVVSDLRPAAGPVPADHVPGIGAASLQLARAVPGTAVGRAVDLGTGCGIQALHLATHAASVVGTDTSPRALRHAALTLALSLPDHDGIELVAGDLLEPVPDDVDLLVANPPFVVGPPRAALTYRDSGRTGDAVTEELLRGIPDRLAPGGVAVLLASWVHRHGEPWADRVAEWVAGGSCDAWVVQRAVVDPAEHTALWLRESGDELGGPVYVAWLDWFAAQEVTAIGSGVVVLRRPAAGSIGPTEVVLQHDEPAVTGDRVAAWLSATDWLRGRADDAVLAARLRHAPGLTLESRAALGPDGWATAGRWLSRLGTHAEVDDAGALLAGGLDGSLPAGLVAQIAGAAYDGGTPPVPSDVAAGLRTLLRAGLLQIPADDDGGG
jgi:methylase of polypeptide subunit release factors